MQDDATYIVPFQQHYKPKLKLWSEPVENRLTALTELRLGGALQIRCLVPVFDGAYFSRGWKEALWDRYYTGAPQRQRRSVERYNIVKRA